MAAFGSDTQSWKTTPFLGSLPAPCRLLAGSVRWGCPLSSLDQRSIIIFLHLKGLSAKDIQTKLVELFRYDAIAYSTVTKHTWKDLILQSEPEPKAEDGAEDQGFSVPDSGILDAR
jgi:hypothetical protein